MSDSTTADTVTMPAAGEDTQAFTPDWLDEDITPVPDPAPGDGPCRCGLCPQPDPDEKGAMLSCAPGVVTRMAKERVRNGQWDNIPRLFREAGGAIHKHAVEKAAGIRLDVEHGVLDIGPVFDRNPDLRSDPELAADLARYEADLAGLLARVQVRGWSALPVPAETRAA